MTDFQVRDKDFAARVRDSFSRQKFMTHLGAVLDLVEPGRVDIGLDFDERLCQQHGFFHGGCLGAIADSAAGYASFSLMEASASVLTIEYKINFVAPARGARLVARGLVVKPGRRVVVARAEVLGIDGSKQTLCAIAQGTFMVMANALDDVGIANAPLPQ
ncbi:MAG: PaaI family thioesterase [Alphaproteobacteria bacterium]